ncbi:MAG: zinc-ribbon domain containing protein [Christensenellales bacterium]|jgi:CxxC-x17-CxxC domain-containing protein
MADKVLKCKECGSDFVFSENEQAFYQEKGFLNEPQRCPECRRAKKDRSRSYDRRMYPAVCAGCGRQTEIPFEPKGDKPVYCKECYQNKR